MTRRLDHAQLLVREEIVRSPSPPGRRACDDHSFELPTGIYAAMGLFFAGAIAVLALAFRGDMGVSFGVIIAFLIAFFGIPAIFVSIAPGESRKALSWRQFRVRGIRTATGLTGSTEATILVLALPFLILGWAIAIVTIAALVS